MKSKRLVFGLLVAAVGVLLLGFNLGWLPMEYRPIIFSWPMILAAVGFISLFGKSCHGIILGVVLMLLGGAFLLSKMDIVDFSAVNIWSMILIALGILIILGALKNMFSKKKKICSDVACGVTLDRKYSRRNFHNDLGVIDVNCIFSGAEEKLQVKDFKGGDINGIFGEVKLDLLDCELAEGVNYLEVNAVFGGVTIFAPASWKIEVKRSCVFGNFLDKRAKPEIEVSENRTLVIDASFIFGGGEVKSFK
ncbi:MAG: cell wall-active antibiotics response protein [Prevotellaceae bacterium]|jgi:predicted membrane protein|nr:cell wall-active antibiotics response protein [Prevotellaceae bacterium]